jgi:hypothetical protein
MWTAGVVLGLSVAAWVVSLFCVCWLQAGYPAQSIALDRGLLIWHNQGAMGPTAKPGLSIYGLGRPRFWWPDGPRQRQWVRASRDEQVIYFYYFVLPLWMPALGAMLLLGGGYLAGGRGRLRVDAGLCPTCNYDLTSIDGVCPECGSER